MKSTQAQMSNWGTNFIILINKTAMYKYFYRYFLRVTVVRRLTDLVKELDLAVHTLSSYPEMNSSIKMEVGIEDSLHIEFEYNKSKYEHNQQAK